MLCVAAMTSFPTKAPAAAYIPHVQTTRTCPHSSRYPLALLLVIQLKITSFPRVPCSHWKKPFPLFPYLSGSLPQSPFPCPWSGWVWCQAYFQGSADGRNSASAPPRCEAHAIDYIMKLFLFSAAIFYFFQWNRFPALFHSIAQQRAGTGKTEEWCSMAWGQMMWYWILGCFWGHRIRKLWPFCCWPGVSLNF